MYGPIRDIFVHVLGYPAGDVDIDTRGEIGRPDVTVRAPSGLVDAQGRLKKLPWIVVEAKDEREAFHNPVSRERIFEQKAKYIGPNTAWLVMVEPDLWVLRPVSGGHVTREADLEVPIALSLGEFRNRVQVLAADRAGLHTQLQQFRKGDPRLIAVQKLSLPNGESVSKPVTARIALNRRWFFQEVRETTALLQDAVRGTLARINPTIQECQQLAQDFWQEYGRFADDGFEPHSLMLRGRPQGAEKIRQHDRAVARVKRQLAKTPSIARLAIHGLPSFQHQTGARDDKVQELFAIETANLILARVLLLRFFEDQGFFGPQHYLCNGGVEAFQKMREYFQESYADLLERAYRAGSRLYAAAFDETELDWLFGLRDPLLSAAIEWTLFRFAQYDFATIKGDILTGIYDRFMDRDQRKKLGEFYTPPSVARYIVKHVGIQQNSRVLDPACGSGTFLIESYRKMIGEAVDRGVAVYADVLEVFERLGGNDLNTFSAVLAQIQLLWQILAFKQDIEQDGFPDIVVTSKINSLIESHQLWTRAERFIELDVRDYDAVIGNPPYIRAERSAQALDAASQKYFTDGGISPKLNPYALFLYRALDRWCRPAEGDRPPGRLGFVIQLSLFDSNATAPLRKLFALGQRWTIKEIVDLEVVYKYVFDAWVYTAVIIVENRPARPDDVVLVRFADVSSVHQTAAGGVPDFDLEGLPVHPIAYPDLFSPDGRILTRLTDTRLNILRKLWTHKTFAEVGKRYWVQLDRNHRIVKWTDVPPQGSGRWEERRMCSRGLIFRRQQRQVSDGLDVYKAENIVATELQGPPVLSRVDVDYASDPGPWRYRDILPDKGYAIARVAHCPNAVAFDPAKVAFTDTATLLFPRDDLQAVPFDLVLLSNIYVWFYALAARMGILRALSSDIYPTNLQLLPWNDHIAQVGPEIEALRSEVIGASRRFLRAHDSLLEDLDALGFSTLKDRVQSDLNARLTWSEFLEDRSYAATIGYPATTADSDETRVHIGQHLFDWVACSRADIAEGLAEALRVRAGESLSRSDLLALRIPVTTDEVTRWRAVVARYQLDILEANMHAALDHLDRLVGKALGLSDDDITTIQRDLQEDAFLKRIRPRYPGTVTRKQGFLSGLDAADRYSSDGQSFDQ